MLCCLDGRRMHSTTPKVLWLCRRNTCTWFASTVSFHILQGIAWIVSLPIDQNWRSASRGNHRCRGCAARCWNRLRATPRQSWWYASCSQGSDNLPLEGVSHLLVERWLGFWIWYVSNWFCYSHYADSLRWTSHSPRCPCSISAGLEGHPEKY